jgi:hypothetical protein
MTLLKTSMTACAYIVIFETKYVYDMIFAFQAKKGVGGFPFKILFFACAFFSHRSN